MVQVSFIGAGSPVFAKTLVTDLLTFPELAGATISLMDIDETRLQKSAQVMERVVAEHDLEATIESTTDRRESLGGADYVISAIHVGGREPFENEIDIPAEYGVGQAVGDTLGPGGVFRALRTIPTMIDIARDMEELCPDALLLNYTNPMAMLCWAVDQVSSIDVIGLCHSVQGTSKHLANIVDQPYEEVDYWVAGINHMAWFLDFTHRPTGRDLYPDLFEAMSDPEIYASDSVRFEIMQHFGYFVTESSSHMSEYVPYFRTEEETIEKHTPGPDEDYPLVSWMPTGQYFNHWQGYQEENRSKAVEDYDTDLSLSEEYGARIIHSIETGQPRRMNINLSNEANAITNLGSDACVEVPCLVDGTGVRPCAVGELPAQLAAVNRSNIAVQRLAVKGAIEDDLDAARQAIKLDPLTAAVLTLDEIDAMIDELLEANAQYLSDALVSDLDSLSG